MWRLLVFLTAVVVVSSVALAQNDPRARSRLNYFNYGWGPGNVRPLVTHGNNPRVRVQMAPRLEWSYAVSSAALATTPREVQLHDSTQTFYHLWIPQRYRHANPHPLILHISNKQFPDEWGTWIDICTKHGVIFAAATGGGELAHPSLRMRLALDVFDDVRRRMAVDTDRVYVTGLGEGARTACELAFAYPEFVGGVLAIGGGSSPRHEPWMRDRMKERLSVAYMTGVADPARREIEVLRFPVLRDLGVRSRVWTVPMLPGTMPNSLLVEQAFLWLEEARAARRAQLVTAPAMRMAEGVVPFPEFWARAVLEEAQGRMKHPEFRESGLLQLEGLSQRWPGGESARQAQKLLARHDERAKVKWVEIYNQHQLRFAVAEAKAFENFLAGPLNLRDMARKPALIQEAIGLWELVQKYGAEKPEAREAEKRIEALRNLLKAG